jgi:hypothetical protein
MFGHDAVVKPQDRIRMDMKAYNILMFSPTSSSVTRLGHQSQLRRCRDLNPGQQHLQSGAQYINTLSYHISTKSYHISTYGEYGYIIVRSPVKSRPLLWIRTDLDNVYGLDKQYFCSNILEDGTIYFFKVNPLYILLYLNDFLIKKYVPMEVLKKLLVYSFSRIQTRPT